MAGLDTNVLVRWTVGDDAKQRQLVRGLLERALAAAEPLFVPNTVLLELEWVIRSRYGYEKASVVALFTALLEAEELSFQDEEALEQALHLYRQGASDFADCLHAGHCASAEQLPMLTFDREAAKLPIAKLLVA
jgi:predicted nucleic-acid-binding protein